MHLVMAADSPIPDIRPTPPPIFGWLEPVIPVLLAWAGAFLVIGLIVIVLRFGGRRATPRWLVRTGAAVFCLGLFLLITTGVVDWLVDASAGATTVPG